MKPKPFELERIQSIYENSVEVNLTESGIEPLSIKELMTDKEIDEFLARLPIDDKALMKSNIKIISI